MLLFCENTRCSHNEVEQRRRQQAKQHYDELRALLPNSSKYDKNAVLHNSILLIQQACCMRNAYALPLEFFKKFDIESHSFANLHEVGKLLRCLC